MSANPSHFRRGTGWPVVSQGEAVVIIGRIGLKLNHFTFSSKEYIVIDMQTNDQHSHQSEYEAREATVEDAAVLLAWRNDEVTRANCRSKDEVSPSDHAAWLNSVIADPDRFLFIIEKSGLPVATVRFDRDTEANSPSYEQSITVAPEERGNGYSREASDAAIGVILRAYFTSEEVCIWGEVYPNNIPSIRLASKWSSRSEATKGGLIRFESRFKGSRPSNPSTPQ